MRFTAAIACWLVAWNCAEQAIGIVPQKLFAANNIWVWGIAATAWLYCGFKLLLNGAR